MFFKKLIILPVLITGLIACSEQSSTPENQPDVTFVISDLSDTENITLEIDSCNTLIGYSPQIKRIKMVNNLYECIKIPVYENCNIKTPFLYYRNRIKFLPNDTINWYNNQLMLPNKKYHHELKKGKGIDVMIALEYDSMFRFKYEFFAKVDSPGIRPYYKYFSFFD